MCNFRDVRHRSSPCLPHRCYYTPPTNLLRFIRRPSQIESYCTLICPIPPLFHRTHSRSHLLSLTYRLTHSRSHSSLGMRKVHGQVRYVLWIWADGGSRVSVLGLHTEGHDTGTTHPLNTTYQYTRSTHHVNTTTTFQYPTNPYHHPLTSPLPLSTPATPLLCRNSKPTTAFPIGTTA